jgi:hypothetical protein
MNEPRSHTCEHFEAMMASWHEPDALSASDRDALTAHIATCAACRESFELGARMEEALVSRSAQVPAVEAFLPVFEPRREHLGHPWLIGVFRTLMSPVAVGIVLTLWGALLMAHFRHDIARALGLSSVERFSAPYHDFARFLLTVSGGSEYTLIAIYVAIAGFLLWSTGAITLRYIRHS